MPEPGSAKYIANKIKAKGLQRLKWYCQACEKQCRDENGWKCHLQSPSHQSKALDPTAIAQYSRQFQHHFVYLLRAAHGTKQVNANKFYGEYIQDRDHVHMNATRWKSLGGFLRFLEAKGIISIDQNEQGLFICYKSDTKPQDDSESEPQDDGLEVQIKRAREQQADDPDPSDAKLCNETKPESVPDTPVAFSIPKKRRRTTKATPL